MRNNAKRPSTEYQRMRYDVLPLDADDGEIVKWAKTAMEKDGAKADGGIAVKRCDWKIYPSEQEVHLDVVADLDLGLGEVGVAEFYDEALADPTPSEEESRLGDEIYRLRREIVRLKGPWWADPSHRAEGQEFVECPGCASRLRLDWCGSGGRKDGHSYENHCPVCGSDLRPVDVLEELDRLGGRYLDGKERFDELKRDRLHPRFLLACTITIEQEHPID